MCKKFNGLWSLAESKLREDPRLKALFVFTNKNRDRLKMLYWDGTGVWIFAQRLEKREVQLADRRRRRELPLRSEALARLLAGIDFRDGCQKAWYER
jgi:transposase